jgi:N-acetylneuraminate synthase
MYKDIENLIKDKPEKDIVIIGKGASIDSIDLSILTNFIILNVNDSEEIISGDISVSHHAWVMDKIDYHCNLYITNQDLPKNVKQLKVEHVPNNPDTADFLLNRFFSNKIYIEDSTVISALRVADEISRTEGIKKSVYLLGFDFNQKSGFTKKIKLNTLSNDIGYQDRVIRRQENDLMALMREKDRLSIEVKHVGDKSYSTHSADAFNTIFSEKYIQNKLFKRKKEDLFSFEREASSQDFKVQIVAEITTNHFGDMDRLKTMISLAKHSGADFIKLQKRNVDTFYSKEQLSASYQSPFGNTFRDYRHAIELNYQQFASVDKICKEVGIGWFASVLDEDSYDFICTFSPEMIKLPSTISEHKDFLLKVAKSYTGSLVISTGFTNQKHEKFILDNFSNVKNLYLLQCTSAYPAPIEDAQIGVVRHYYNLSKKVSNVIPGFSSHDIGSTCSMMAVAAGAKMIEKHVKLGNVIWSHFDEVAIELGDGQFQNFVSDIRSAEKIVGSEEKIIHNSEHHKY